MDSPVSESSAENGNAFTSTTFYRLLSGAESSLDLRGDLLTYLHSPKALEDVVIELKDDMEGTYLHYIASLPPVIQQAALPSVYKLCSMGININATDSRNNTALHLLIRNGGYWKVVRALQRCGANLSTTNDNGKLPRDLIRDSTLQHYYDQMDPSLWESIESGEKDRVEDLLSRWCFLHMGRKSGSLEQEMSMVDLAALCQNHSIMEMVEKQANNLSFIKAALSGDIQKMSKLLKEHPADINVNSFDGSFQFGPHQPPSPLPLFMAVAMDTQDMGVINFLCDNGVDMNSFHTHMEIKGPAFFLLEMTNPLPPEKLALEILERADLSLRNERGENFLFLAAKKRSTHYLTSLLEKGVNLADRDIEGHTAYCRSLMLRQSKITKTYHNYVINLLKTDNIRVLSQLVTDGFEYIPTIVQQEGLAVQDLNETAQSFLNDLSALTNKLHAAQEAVAGGDIKRLSGLLTEQGNLAGARDKAGRTLLHLAALHQQMDLANQLAEDHPALIKERDCHGRSPVHYATAMGGLGKSLLTKLVQTDESSATLTDFHNQQASDYTDPAPANTLWQQLQADKTKFYGRGIYLLFRYNELEAAVKSSAVSEAMHLVKDLKQVTLDDVVAAGQGQISLVKHCFQNKEEDLGSFLLENTENPEVLFSPQDDTEEFAERVREAGMMQLYGSLARNLHLRDEDAFVRNSTPESLKSDNVATPSFEPYTSRQVSGPLPAFTESRYLAQVLGTCLPKAMAATMVLMPEDPIDFIAKQLRHYADTEEYRKKMREHHFQVELVQAEDAKNQLRKKRCAVEADNLITMAREREQRKLREEERRRKRQEEEERLAQQKQKESGHLFHGLDPLVEEEEEPVFGRKGANMTPTGLQGTKLELVKADDGTGVSITVQDS